MTNNLSVREIQKTDFESIVDYFLKADHAFLHGMGVDTAKLPKRQDWLDILNKNFIAPIEKKQFFYVIWQIDHQPVGHSNINKIIYGEEAYMHLHLWNKQSRQNGMGLTLLQMTLPYYFDRFRLKKLYCEPSASNPAPNKTLEKIDFEFIKSYETMPGWINYYQKVNKWCLTKDKFRLISRNDIQV